MYVAKVKLENQIKTNFMPNNRHEEKGSDNISENITDLNNIPHYPVAMTGLFGSKKAEEAKPVEVKYDDEAFNYFMEELFQLHLKKIHDEAVSYKSLMSILPRVDHNKQDDKGTTPIMMACMCGAPEILREFLKRKDQHNINAQRNFGKDTALHLAIGHVRDNFECFKQLVEREDVDVNIKDSLGKTPLMSSVFFERLHYVNELLKRDDVNLYITDYFNENALHRAKSQYGCEEIYRALKEYESKHPYGITDDQLRKLMNGDLSIIHQVDLNAQNGDYSYTPLMYVLDFSDSYPSIVNEILKQDGLDINKQAYDGKTALIQAISKKYASNDDILAILSHPDIDVNITDCQHRTALIHAVIECNAQIVEELLKRPDIDISIKDCNGEDAMMYACGTCEKILKAFADNRFISSLCPEENVYNQREITNKFMEFIRNKDFERAEKMLEITPLIDFSQSSRDNDNAVEWAVFKLFKNELMSDAEETIKFVRKMYDYMLNKQPTMLEDYQKRRTEMFRKFSGIKYDELLKMPIMIKTVDGLKYLTTRNAFDPNYVLPGHNVTLFDMACRIDSTGELVKYILEHYPDVKTDDVYEGNEKNNEYIDYYNKTGKYKIALTKLETDILNPETSAEAVIKLKEFAQNTATVEMVDIDNNNALHVAAMSNSEITKEIIYILIRKGFDINAQNKAGQTPLMLALKYLKRVQDKEDRRRMFGIIRFLIDKGADVNVCDINKQTVLHYACASGSPTALKMVIDKNPNAFLRDKNGKPAKEYLSDDEMKQIYNDYLKSIMVSDPE